MEDLIYIQIPLFVFDKILMFLFFHRYLTQGINDKIFDPPLLMFVLSLLYQFALPLSTVS